VKCLVRFELCKLRTTSTSRLFGLATLLSTVAMLVFNTISAHSPLKPFDAYVALQTHGHGAQIPAQFLARLRDG